MQQLFGSPESLDAVCVSNTCRSGLEAQFMYVLGPRVQQKEPSQLEERASVTARCDS